MVVQSCRKSGMKNALELGERERESWRWWVGVSKAQGPGRGLSFIFFLKNAVLGLGLG